MKKRILIIFSVLFLIAGAGFFVAHTMEKDDIETELYYKKATQLYEEKKYEESFREFLKAAKNGDANAQYNLGLLYANGTGTEKNVKEAIRWYNEAAKRQHLNAYHNLGMLFETGDGVAKDIEKAGEFYGKAASLGLKASRKYLEKNLKYCGISNAAALAKQEVNQQRAADACLLVASSGNTEGQYQTGVAYYFGTVSEKNPQNAKEWFFKAAQNGHVMAQFRMMGLYVKGTENTGIGVSNLISAYAWSCVLEKQANIPGSMGLEEWQKINAAQKTWELKAQLEKDVFSNLSRRKIAEKSCKDYVNRYYRQPTK